jgi:hypothetical protein
MSFFAPQNPGIGGLDELTNAEEIFLTTLAGLTYSEGDYLQIVGGNLVWAPSSASGAWDKPFGDATFTYDVDGNIDTKTVGAVVLTFTYDIDGNIDTISDGSNVKTFTYDVDGNVDTITYL